MATTRIMPLHAGKGRTVGKAISDIIDYVKNPDKTDHGRLITSYQCDSRVADAQFLLDKQTYAARTGRVRGADDVIAYHLRQSFVPGEITPEEANRLGVELARRFTKGKHAFIVCTHIDKAHIHNHIIWNSTTLECDRKFRNFWGSTRAVHRLSDTICIENGYGKEDATQEEIENAARLANCYDFIMQMPDGFDTMIGEGGSTLSGGEKQRISIARAILKNAPVVLLDEATSSLDPENEAQIQQAISRLVQGRTVVVIAHRLKTVVGADKLEHLQCRHAAAVSNALPVWRGALFAQRTASVPAPPDRSGPGCLFLFPWLDTVAFQSVFY